MAALRSFGGRGREELWLLPALAFIALFYVLPLVNLVARSFSGEGGGATLDQFRTILATPAFTGAWINSVLFAGASTAIALAGGLLLAVWTAARRPRLRATLLAVYALPYTMSGLVVAFGFVVLTGRNGLVNQILGLMFEGGPFVNLRSWGGLLAVFPFYNVPLAALILTPLVEKLGRDLSEAAAVCGAGRVATWALVLIPALRPGLVAAGSLVFAAMMGAFGTTLAITGFSKNLLSLQIYAQSSDSGYNLPLASALAVTLMATTVAVLLVIGLTGRRQT
jgi:ABC-type Fe3+ transport system permease subunit